MCIRDRTTSSLVSGWKAVKDTPGRTALKVGGGASFVLDRTFSTFSVRAVELLDVNSGARRNTATPKEGVH